MLELGVLIALLVFVLALLVTALAHLFLRVPYVPTPHAVCAAMVQAAKLQKGETVLDLGCGDARLLMHAAKAEPTIRAIGCEVVPTVWILGYIRSLFSRPRVTVRLRSALKETVEEADVLLIYLTPPILRKLMPKFDRELKKGCRIVSHAFKLPGLEPDEVIPVKRSVLGPSNVYVYYWK